MRLGAQAVGMVALWAGLALGTSGRLTAAPVTLSLVPDSSLSLTFSSPIWQRSTTVTQGFTGTITADLTLGTQAGFGQVATIGRLLSADLSGANVTTDMDLGFLGGLRFTTAGLGGSVAGPSVGFVPPPLGTGQTQFPLTSTQLTLNEGSITYEGLGVLAQSVGLQTINLDLVPLTAAFPPADRWRVDLTGSPNPADAITLTLPVSVTARLLSEPFVLDVSLAGTLMAKFGAECVQSTLVGDANNDGGVGAADYAIWAATFGQSGECLSADFDRNGSVGAGDYALWAANFGKTAGGASAHAPAAAVANVPEPTSMGLVIVGAWCMAVACRRLRHLG